MKHCHCPPDGDKSSYYTDLDDRKHRDDDDDLKRSGSTKAIEELRVFESQSSNTKKTDVRRRKRRLPGHEAPGEETRKRKKATKKRTQKDKS